MKHPRPAWSALLFALLAPAAAGAAELAVTLELPRIDVAEYHRPYVAVWLEDESRKQVAQLALWLEQEKWHRDLRGWWRRGGSALALPVDGVSAATRRPGEYRVTGEVPLEPGRDYTLNVEAVREVGGREHLRLPFTWKGQPVAASGAGDSELGRITLQVTE